MSTYCVKAAVHSVDKLSKLVDNRMISYMQRFATVGNAPNALLIMSCQLLVEANLVKATFSNLNTPLAVISQCDWRYCQREFHDGATERKP